MKAPRDLLDLEAPELTERLLRSFREDVPPRHGKRATLAALGIGAATTSVAGSASALMGVAKVGMLGVAKAFLGGALAGAIVVGTSSYITHKSREARPVAVSAVPTVPAAKAPPAARPVPAPKEPEIEVPVVAEAPPSAVPAPAPARPRDEAAVRTVERPSFAPLPAALPPAPDVAPSSAPPIAKPSTLSVEIALLDEARLALSEGAHQRALMLLDRHDREFGHGALGPEAVVLRIDAMLRTGDVAGARGIADQFERAHPNDSHLSRIRSLLAQHR
jgi:hypothetical protein